MKIMSKRSYGISVEYNSALKNPWVLIAWDSANQLNVYEMFEDADKFKALVAEVRGQFNTDIGNTL